MSLRAPDHVSGRRWSWRRSALASAAALSLVLMVVLYVLFRTPTWYRPPVVQPDQRQAVRNNLINAEQAFTESLRSGGRFVYHLYQDDVNRWIAMRREIYPLIDEIAPPVLIDPVVLFRDDAITIAGRFPVGPTDVVLSVDIKPELVDDKILLRVTSVRCGSFPVPRDFGDMGLGERTDLGAEALWPGSPAMSGDFLSGFRIDTAAWWKNGGVDYRVVGLAVRSGRLDLTIEPIGRHADARRRDQSLPD